MLSAESYELAWTMVFMIATFVIVLVRSDDDQR